MPTNRWHRHQNMRRQDMVKVTIEDVNLNATPFPVAQGRDRRQSWGLFDIDLSHGVGGSFPTPAVGEVWWIKRSIGSRWVLDHKVDPDREPSEGGGGGGDQDRSGVPNNLDMGFNVREKKKELEYEAFVTFDPVTTDENGDPADPEYYVINWVPCTKVGNVIANEKVRQYIWNPNDAEIDDPTDPAADYYVVLPGNVPRPKVWYWKARARAVSTGGAKGEWSDWTDPALPFREALPQPPAPNNVNLIFKWKDTQHQPVFSAITRFDDVNYWDIPGFDYEDDVTEYEVVLQPLQRQDQYIHDVDPELTEINLNIEDYPPGTIYGDDGHFYVRADPNNDGTPWPNRRQKVKDKDDDDYYSPLGTIGEDITAVDTIFDVDETGVVDGPPTVPFVVQTSGNEKWLVYDRTSVGGNLYTYEVYRQFTNTNAESHLTGEVLTWLNDPYVYKVDFHHIERPRRVYWRTRVRSKDRFNRIGPWSNWTIPRTPWESIDWAVPPPEQLKADIEIRDYKTHPEFKLVARFKDPAPNGWNIPGGDLQDDLDHYAIVAEAVLPDPDGYIRAKPPPWDATVEYEYNQVVEHEGARYRSLVGNNVNNEPVSGGSAFWDVTTDDALFRIPDRKIGVLNAPAGLGPAETTMTITLDSDLPDSIMRVLDNIDKRATYLRILTPASLEEGGVSEVVATTEQTSSSGQDRTYTIERMQKGSGDWGHNDGDHVFLLTEHLRRRRVGDKDKDDPGHFNRWYTVDMGRIAQPKRFYWRVRGRSVDTFGHKSVWTEWTQPLNPSTDPDLIIDAPSYVALDFDRVHRSRWNRWRAIVEFAEVHYTAPDGDREEDVTRYAVQLATTDGDELDLEVDTGDSVIYVVEKRKSPDEVPFFILIDDEMMEVTDRTNVADNVWAYTVSRAEKSTVAAYHPEGSRIYEYPFLHQTISAKNDDDRNNFNRAVFPRAQKFRHYKARVKAHDRYNRNSEWTPWTPDGTPSDNNPPVPPTNVLLDIDNHKAIVNWDYPSDPDDTDPDLGIASDDAAYFQVQLSKFQNFSNVLKFDRYVSATHKTFRIKKPRNDSFWARVRAVDASGNKSAWVTTESAQGQVATPGRPVLTFDTNEETKKLRALVLLEVGVTNIDDDVDGYEFQLQPAEFKRLAAIASIGADNIYVNNSNNVPNPPFVIRIQKEKLRVTNVNTTADKWAVIRGIGTSVPAKHRRHARVQYFRNPSKSSPNSPPIRHKKTGEEAEQGDPVLAIFTNIQKGLWYRARVRAHNTQGRWSEWSEWSR